MSAAVEGRVHITHPDIPGSSALVSSDEAVVEHYTAKGWAVDEAVPAELDPDAPNLDATPAVEAPAVDEGGAADELPAPASAPAPSPRKASTGDTTGEVTRG